MRWDGLGPSSRSPLSTFNRAQDPVRVGDVEIRVAHDPAGMGWLVGDRIAVAPTDDRSSGDAQSFFIKGFGPDRVIQLSRTSTRYHEAANVDTCWGHSFQEGRGD